MTVRLGPAAAAALLVLVGCGGPPAPSSAPGSNAAGSQSLTVFAAASLKTSFTAIGRDFERAHPGTTLRFNFAGSSDLVTQLQQGAPADVFASADTTNMDKATGDDLVDADPVLFATNILEIAVPPDNPAGIGSFADLAKPGVKTVVCAAQVPCGAATLKVQTATGIRLRPVSEETSVTDVLNKVLSGEADAGVVYRTDVRSAGAEVGGIAFPEAERAVNSYPVAVLAGSRNRDLARTFLALVTGPDGRRVLSDAGFGLPS